MIFIIFLGVTVGVIFVMAIWSWLNFNFERVSINYVKLSHRKFWQLYKEHENIFEFDDEFFAARLYIKMEHRYRVKLNLADYLYLQMKAKRECFDQKHKYEQATRELLNKELSLKEQIAWLTNPDRIRKELDENGFPELNYTNSVMIDAKHIEPTWNGLKEHDVVCELRHKDLEITHFELYVIVKTNISGLKSIPIGEYAKLKKENADDK